MKDFEVVTSDEAMESSDKYNSTSGNLNYKVAVFCA